MSHISSKDEIWEKVRLRLQQQTSRVFRVLNRIPNSIGAGACARSPVARGSGPPRQLTMWADLLNLPLINGKSSAQASTEAQSPCPYVRGRCMWAGLLDLPLINGKSSAQASAEAPIAVSVRPRALRSHSDQLAVI